MKVLMLTWEYPPFIVGGLGMACYGLFKALAEKGVKIYMILPTKEKVFFEISSGWEADFPVAKSPHQRQLKPLPLKFYQIGYLAPEGAYLDTLRLFSYQPENTINFLEEKKPLTPISEKVLKRIENLLNKENHTLSRVQRYLQNVLEVAKHLEVDLIHAHDWMTYPAGLFLKHLLQKPLVAHVHATEFDRAIGYGHPVVHEIEYLGLNLADRVIAVSNYTAQVIKEHYKVPEEKIRVLYNAFTVYTKEPKKTKKFKSPVILFLGRLTPQKGPKIFLEIAKKILRQYPKKVRFLIAGAGEMERELMFEAASEGFGTQVLFTGFLTRQEVEEALSLADIVVMPSVSEPFGIVALEAMYFGCALIISKQSGASEILENAYKVDFWDVDKIVNIIVDLLKHPEKLKNLQQKVKEEVKKISWDIRAEELIKIYNELLIN